MILTAFIFITLTIYITLSVLVWVCRLVWKLINNLKLKAMFNLFKQKEATLFNGKKVKEGDKIFFINSDGEKLEGIIERRNQDYDLAKPAGHEPRFQQPHEDKVLKKGTLFFWNPQFLITDYFTADLS